MKIKAHLYVLLCLAMFAVPGCNAARKSAQKSANEKKEFQVRHLTEANNRFSMDLFKQIHPGSENIIYSPYSISNILALVYGGASGETAAEIRDVLYFPENHITLHPAEKSLRASMDSINSTPGTEMGLANAIWAQENFSFRPEYFELIQNFYDAPLELVDFIQPNRREENRIHINDWVANNTNQRIRDLIQPGVLDANTRMVLTNAIYFNGKWMFPFSKNSTLPSVFHVSQEETVRTVFMNQTKTFPYYEDEDVQAISLPYQGGRMSMLVILPKKVEGWEMVSRVLDYDRIQLVASGMTDTEVQVSLPRFQSELSINLRKELISMGMEQVFSRYADLSGMTGEKNLFISEIVHKAFIEVTEAGTEAAAATAAIIALKSALTEVPVQFKADHPFIYLLRDEVTGIVIFAGRLVRPSEIV